MIELVEKSEKCSQNRYVSKPLVEGFKKVDVFHKRHRFFCFDVCMAFFYDIHTKFE